jgi:hypothetical protein
MDKNKYITEIWKRIREKIEMRYGAKRAVFVSIIAPIIVNAIAYIALYRWWGADTANQQIVSFVIVTIGLEALLLVLFLFFARYYDVPQEIHNEQEKIIEEKQKTIADFERRLSNKKIKIIDLDSRLTKNDVDVELRPTICNDSCFPMENWFVLVEELKYVKNNNEKPIETNFPKDIFHLVWPGDPAIAYRKNPIAPHDYAQFTIAATIINHDAFKLETIESDRFNKFVDAGFYLVTLKIGGTFDGVGVTRRIMVSISYDGKKGLKVATYFDLPDEE